MFVFRDLHLGHLSKEQVVGTIDATNIDARVFRGGKLIYDSTTPTAHALICNRLIR
jgi:hypothetical protein